MLPRRIPGQCIRTFSTTPRCASNVGIQRLSVPSNVTLVVSPPPPPKHTKFFKPSPRHHPLGGPSVRESDAQTVTITGPLGSLHISVPPFISLVPAWTVDRKLASQIAEAEAYGKVAPERNDLVVVVTDDKSRKQREMWGTIRALLHNSIRGVSSGHQTTLTLKGVGYRAAIVQDGKTLELKVGFNHNVNADIPEGVDVSMTNPTLFEVKCIDKQKLGLFCARVRKFRPPEPYKGKVLSFKVFLMTGDIRWERDYQNQRRQEEIKSIEELWTNFLLDIVRAVLDILRTYITDSKSITKDHRVCPEQCNPNYHTFMYSNIGSPTADISGIVHFKSNAFDKTILKI
jgi:large subunit ribosomal protein L6